MATEVKKATIAKKPLKAVEQKPRMSFAFERKNYMILLFGIVLIILGYVLLAGGGTKDPNQFSYELFSTQRMVTAPIILMLGYITIAVAIMYKEKPKHQEEPPVS
jgi:membrane-bound ClpP family serine protease